ncbi:3-oxoacyl-ACP synthase [Antrihabitans sp. YC3-6]|uniref:3-oxoacyl-ACP synthase n=1 Tax=Antrihabitans stalagmiti TaxID=2799499 RepID=A0A934NU05_9NOCA|nr:3-oxoacyl-[acyl-carrier-protein] synthase III C-terminal domain-containing protein [Antrihabitans stalagmiti]MBJ8341277.1 3-oxoacyl-ACP synthase [Antrihabitans stalagmiti]
MQKRWLVMEDESQKVRSPYRTRIAGAGRQLPSTHMSTTEVMATTKHRTHIDLERLTGIHERRVSAGEHDSLTLATAAAQDSLRHAGRRGEEIEVVINCSITKFRDGLTQWLEPTMSSAIAKRIGATGALTFDISNACAGMLTGVAILNNWIRQGLITRGMVVSGEYISPVSANAARHVHNVMSKELASLTVGDAGAALVLERAQPGSGSISVSGFTTIADHSRLCLAYPKGHEPAARMFTNSRAIHKVAISDTPVLFQEVLDTAGLSLHDIDHVITHQTSARAIRKGMAELVEKFGDAPRHDAVITVDKYGNTASTTHTVALVDEFEAQRIEPGETVALVALASGLEIGVVLFTPDKELLESYGNSH